MNNLKIYPEFVANQTLSHENLNALLKYLDAEQRQTREQLIGTGILCGLHLHPKGQNTYLSPGIAISTDGYILTIDKQFEFNYYRKYQDKGESYLPLKGNAFEVLDKIPEDETESNLFKFAELDDPEIRQGVVVVYLEDHLKDIESCEGESCDNKGQEHRLSIKVLIIPKKEAASYVDNDATFYSDIDEDIERHPAYNLGRLKITRPLINENIVTLNGLKSLFANCVKKAENDLSAYINKLKKVFPKETAEFPHPSEINSAVSEIFESKLADFQQVYDWFESLFRAINEWVDVVQSSHLQCIKKSRRFQRHVFTGSMTKQDFGPQLYRHYFEAAANDTLSNNTLEIQNILLQRIKLIIERVKVNNLRGIGVLPEKRTSSKLADRAIPYFLNYSSLKKYWKADSDLVSRLDFDNFGINREKLHCSFEDKDFFRIEGHVGMSRKDALDQLQGLREEYNLEFDIKALYVDRPRSKEKIDCCSYETLRLMYEIVSEGLKISLLEAFSASSRLSKYKVANDFVTTQKISNFLKNGYKVSDYRHFNVFEEDKEQTEALNFDIYEGLKNFLKENPDSASAKVKRALKANNDIIAAGGDTTSEVFTENHKIIKEFQKKEAPNLSPNTNSDIPLAGEGSASVSEGAFQPKMAKISSGRKITDEMNARIEEIMALEEVSESPEMRRKLERLVEDVQRGPNTKEVQINDFRVVHDGSYNLLVNDTQKQLILVESNPLGSGYSDEVMVEKTIPSIMVDTYDLLKKIPDSLERFSDESIKENYEILAAKVIRTYSSLEKVHENYKCHWGIKLILQVLNNFNFSSWLVQLKKINDIYNEKQRDLEEKNILANIVKNNPGLEHRAGVPIGGTFFLLTQKGGNASKEPSEESYYEFITNALRKSGKENALKALEVIKSRNLTEKEKINEVLEEYGLFEIIGKEVTRKGISPFSRKGSFRDDNMADDVVVGDFCLNSTIECCDLRYIVHTDVRLDAPKKIFCDDDKTVNLDVHPRGGKISGPGTSQEGHNYRFDPAHPDVATGENILTYTIADQKVDLIVEVLKHPTAKINILSKKIDNNEAIIEVEAQAKNGDKYEWSYDDGKPVEGKKKHTFRIPAESSEIEVTIKLRVSNKACFATDSERVKLTDVQLIIKDKIVCSTSKPVELRGTPSGGKFSGKGVSGSKFDPAKVTFKENEVQKAVSITYTKDGDSETKDIAVIKHPEAKIIVVEERLFPDQAVLHLQNGTKPIEGYTFIWDVNGSRISGQSEIHNEFKYIDGKVTVKLTVAHRKLITCNDTAEIVFEQPVNDDPQDDNSEKARLTFEAIKKENSKNNEFFTQFKDSLNNLEFNPDIVTGQEMKLVQSLLNFVNQVTFERMIESAEKLFKMEMEEVIPKLQKAQSSGIAGPEITMYGIRLVTALNILAIIDKRVAVATSFKAIEAVIDKAKAENPDIKYSLQPILESELWLNNDNRTQSEKLWSSIQP